MNERKILVIDDEADTLNLLKKRLSSENYGVFIADNPLKGIEIAKSKLPDLIILDLSMPDMDGFEVCRTLRGETTTSRIPIIMLTARMAKVDEALGLELGADDYVNKPYDSRVLLNRIKKCLDRSEIWEQAAAAAKPQEILRAGGLMLDTTSHTLKVDGNEVFLTALEFRILKTFMENPGQLFDRDGLIRNAWKEKVMVGRAVDVHITNLRNKIKPYYEYIQTVYGAGYRFRGPEEVSTTNAAKTGPPALP